MINSLVTHAGAFHADDLLAYTVLSDLYPDAKLVRTRDEDILNAHKTRGIVFDTGGAYDPANNIFDHHQKDAPKREDGSPYAAFGLVWKHFGTRWLVKCAGIPSKHADTVWEGIDKTLVRQVDRVDNAQITNYDSIETDITSAIFRANPADMDMNGNYTPATAEDRDAAFKRTKAWVQPLVVAQAQGLGREAIGKEIVQKALDARTTPGLVVLDTPVPWTKSIFECQGQKTARIVTFPTGTKDEWALQTVPTEPQGLTPRESFPQAWRGLRGADMAKASGVKDAHFCHNGGFFCAVKGKEAALALGQKTLQVWKDARQDQR